MSDEIPSSAPEQKSTRELLTPVRRLIYILFGLIIFWAIFGELVPTLLFPPEQPATPMQQQAAAPVPDPLLLERLNKAEARIAELEEQVKKPVIASIDTTELNAEISELEKKIEALQQKPDGTLAMHHLSLLTVYGQIKEAIARGEHFEAAHTQLTALSQARPKTLEFLQQLKPYTIKSAPSLDQLKQGFGAALQSALSGNTDKHSLKGNLHSLIRIRKVGEPEGGDDQAILARAESKLARGEIEAAASELAALTPEAKQAFAPWLERAEHYIKLHTIMDALQLDLSQPNAMLPLPPLPVSVAE